MVHEDPAEGFGQAIIHGFFGGCAVERLTKQEGFLPVLRIDHDFDRSPERPALRFPGGVFGQPDPRCPVPCQGVCVHVRYLASETLEQFLCHDFKDLQPCAQ